MARWVLAWALLGAPADGGAFQENDRIALALWDGDRAPEALREMAEAGVDVVLAAPAGDPEVLAAVLERLAGQGVSGPAVAPFLDLAFWEGISPAREVDLVRRYAAVRAWMERLPARRLARVADRPLVVLGPRPAGTPPEFPLLARLAALFREDFGGRSAYLVAHASWGGADRFYARWAEDPSGAREHAVVSVGSDGGLPGERAWRAAGALGFRWVITEAWGTEDSAPQARALAARALRLFRRGEILPAPKGPRTGHARVGWSILYTPHEQGLRPVENDDGRFERVRAGAFVAVTTRENSLGRRRHLYFDVDDSFAFFEKRACTLAVEFWDVGEGRFVLEYDSADPRLPPPARAVKTAGEVAFRGTGGWRTEAFDVPDALFGNGQKGGADFRLAVEGRGLSVRSIVLTPR
ncbi:MAG: hypothetical protein ACK44W_07805 [Planctomycetota bacterium]